MEERGRNILIVAIIVGMFIINLAVYSMLPRVSEIFGIHFLIMLLTLPLITMLVLFVILHFLHRRFKDEIQMNPYKKMLLFFQIIVIIIYIAFIFLALYTSPIINASNEFTEKKAECNNYSLAKQYEKESLCYDKLLKIWEKTYGAKINSKYIFM